MNLKNLFEHKLLEARTKPDNTGEGLVYAVNQDVNSSSIYLYVNGENDIHLGDRWHTVTSLCVHNNWLYDGGYQQNKEFLGFVIDTITGKDRIKRDKLVYSLASHNEKIYFGGYGYNEGFGIFEVPSGKTVALRSGKVTALCIHEGELYDGGYYKGVHNTFRNEVNSKKKYVPCLCSDKSSLYGVDYKFDENFYFHSKVFDVLKGKSIKNVEELVTSLCSYKGDLYYVYRGIIRRLLDDDVIFCDKLNISATCSIPAELAEQIRHTKNYGFSFNEVQRINPKGAIEYLTNVSDSQERRRIIEQLFNCEHVHEDVIDWLNEHEKDIMRKAAFY